MESRIEAVRGAIKNARQRLSEVPDCRNKSVALTHLDNAEVMSASPHLDDDDARATEGERFLLLAWGFEDRASKGPG